ncbi:MAG TPA: hypothetical protein ENI66_00590 [Candidatus Yonathbacteria bacterium]|nr:hypothetical protein [Candidatus Yonathbacteria bacterium]
MAVKSKSAQSFVPIKEVRDGIVILKDGTMKIILMTSSVNFALKSEDEQTGLLMQFQNFLNSLEFTTQISIQSRRLDIKPYLATLQERVKGQLNDLMRIQTEEYIEFIRSFTESTNIMTKTFLVIVPYAPEALLNTKRKILDKIILKKDGIKAKPAKIDLEIFEEARSQLQQRANVIKQGLARVGVRAVPLGTEEIIEMYYKIFNPSDTQKAQKV